MRGRRDSNGDLIKDNGLEKIPECDKEEKFRGSEFEQAERAADARLGRRKRLGNVIDLIV